MQKHSRFFNEIFTSPIIVHEAGLSKYLPVLKAFYEKGVIQLPERVQVKMSIFDMFGIPQPDNHSLDTENNVAVIPITGVLTRAGSWWDMGTDDIAELIDEANDNDSISAIILKTNCYGGSVDALSPIQASLTQKKKPCIAAVDSVSYSLGYFINTLCDKIYAVNKMCSVGSIGIMVSYTDYSEYYKQFGIKQIDVYPPESDWKNKPQREAMQGNTELLIKEQLSPWAQYFQETVRATRPNLNDAVEGTLSGRTFFAKYTETNAMINGLIDGVMPFEDIVQYAFSLSQAQKAKSIFTKI
jgi:ClpP class serine protease